MLVNLLTNLGFTRDSAMWLWGRIISAAALISSGVLDLKYWAGYVGLYPSDNLLHFVTVTAVVILWISGKMATSHLPAKESP